MRILFLMDPLETVIPHKDTTLALMVGAARRGHEVFYLSKQGMSLVEGKLNYRVVPVTPSYDDPVFVRQESRVLTDGDIDAVFIRTDPPFDETYLHHTWLLDRSTKTVVNSPGGIRTVNEKLWVTQFSDLVPPTCVSQRIDVFKAFGVKHKQTILKPTDGFGGASVFLLKPGDSNLGVIIDTVTQRGRRPAIMQRYVPQADQGDKRILLLDGEILGAVMRVHGEGDHRNNFFSGGTAEPAEVNARDRQIVEVLSPHLKQLGLFFVGIDVIGDTLIEVNVTSPTCLQEMNRLYGWSLEDRVIEALEGRIGTGLKE